MTAAQQVFAEAETIRRLAAARGVHNLRLFGSVLRGDARPDSDVDLLIEVEAGHGLLDLAALTRELGELLGRRVDLVPEAGLKAGLREQVLSEARPL